MFISTPGFKRMVREAFKQGLLKIAREEGDLIIRGRHWHMIIDPGFLPNKGKAALIEIAGELPEEGEQFLCQPDGSNQMMILEGRAMLEGPGRTSEYKKTEVLIDPRYRIFQEPYSYKIVAADAYIVDQISNIYLEDDEDPVSAPYSDGKWISYASTSMNLIISTYVLGQFPYLTALEGVLIEKEA